MSPRAKSRKGKKSHPHEPPPAGNRQPPPVPLRLPVWKKAFFGLLVTVLVFVAAELLLLAFGVRPLAYDEDPYVGFSAQLPLFVDQTEPDGPPMMVTAVNKQHLFNRQQFVRDKPAGVYRIFCMGGSTSYGRPYDDRTSFCGWLRELLPVADPSREWEVINAGGISYASYRVALLMEELIQYEPDLFVIYSGQNEFLERRTYEGIIQMPASVRGLGGLLSRTRTYTAFKQLAHGAPRSKQALPQEVETLLDDTLGPDDFHRDDGFHEQVLAHYRYNLARMIDIARSVSARVILVLPASNLRDCSPFKSQHVAGLSAPQLQRWEDLYQTSEQDYDNSQWTDALAKLDEAQKIDPRHAELHYLRGRVLYALGRYPDAKAALQRARDEDVCPLRALSPMGQIVKDVATEREVPLVDFDALVEDRAEHGIPGDDLFLDHVHPTIEGNRLLALELLTVMVRAGAVQTAASWGPKTIQAVKKRVEDSLDEKAHGIALRGLSMVLGWAGKHEEARKLAARAAQMVPEDAEAHFRAGASAQQLEHFEEAAQFYQQALAMDPDHPQAHNKLGTLLHRKGDLNQALQHFQRAVQLLPDFADALNNLGVMMENQGKLVEAQMYYEGAVRAKPNNPQARYNLGGLFERQRKIPEAIEQYRTAIRLKPNSVEGHNNLGLVLERQGNLDEALTHYQHAIRLKPNYPEAHANIGVVYLRRRNPAKAIEQFERALSIDPEYEYAREGIKRARAMQ